MSLFSQQASERAVHDATKTNDRERRSTLQFANVWRTRLKDSAIASVFRLFFVVVNFRNVTGVALQFPSCSFDQDIPSKGHISSGPTFRQCHFQSNVSFWKTETFVRRPYPRYMGKNGPVANVLRSFCFLLILCHSVLFIRPWIFTHSRTFLLFPRTFLLGQTFYPLPSPLFSKIFQI